MGWFPWYLVGWLLMGQEPINWIFLCFSYCTCVCISFWSRKLYIWKNIYWLSRRPNFYLKGLLNILGYIFSATTTTTCDREESATTAWDRKEPGRFHKDSPPTHPRNREEQTEDCEPVQPDHGAKQFKPDQGEKATFSSASLSQVEVERQPENKDSMHLNAQTLSPLRA